MARAFDDRSAPTAAERLRPLGVPSIAVRAEPVRTEGVMRFAEYLEPSSSRSAQGVGRAVGALTADPDHLTLSGRIHEVSASTARYRSTSAADRPQDPAHRPVLLAPPCSS